MSNIKAEILQIERQTAALREFREEIESSPLLTGDLATQRAIFDSFNGGMIAEREEWEADQAAVAEYETWYLQNLLLESDVESLGMTE